MRRYFSENIISRVLVICFITSFFSGVNVYAIEEKNNNIQDINIVSRTTITKEEAKEWARKNNATDTFINLADLYWKYYNQHGGVNPLVAYIQSAKETAYGRFGGVIDESYYNPCGMKKADAGTEDDDYDPNAHHRFNNWEEGVKAHLDHLALYAGAKTYPREETYDPRHSKWILGQATTVNSLGGKWAPSTSYGREIMKTYKYVLRLFDVGESLINANLNIANGKLNISGWALNKSGVREIRYYIDGAYQGKATVGISTPELVDEYPGYPNVSKSGFNISLDLSKLKPGKRKIEIGQIGNDGTKKSEAYYYEVPSMENRIDAKVSATNNKLNVNGWALNKSGVKEVRYYIDGTYQGKTTVGLSTPELVNKYPSYPNAAKSGFNISLDLSKLKPGKRKIEIGQIGNDGTKKSEAYYYNVHSMENRIDAKVSAANNKLNVNGWALNKSGVKEIRYYIDGAYQGKTAVGSSTPELVNKYPGYPNVSKSGFNISLDLSKLKPGKRKIEIGQIGNDGTKKSEAYYYNVHSMENRIDAKVSATNNKLNVNGWALNKSGVKEIRYYIDGTYQGKTAVGSSTPELVNKYPGYPNVSKSGFNISLDLSKLKPGRRKIEVGQIGNDGSVRSEAYYHTVASGTKMDFSLKRNKNILTIDGWALNKAGVKELRYYIDGEYKGKIDIGLATPSLPSKYPEYPNTSKSGFNINLEINKLQAGNRKIEVGQIGHDGSKQSKSMNFYVDRPNIIDLGLEFDFGLEGPLPNNPQKLVLHHAAGNTSVTNVHDWHQNGNGWAGIGYHFYIHKDGKIYKGREENWRGAHAAEVGSNDGNLSNDTNATSLGIAVQGDYMGQTMPKAQEDAVVKIGQYAVAKYGISQVFGHGSPGIGHTSCPGKNYPFARIKARILAKTVYGYDTDNLENIPN